MVGVYFVLKKLGYVDSSRPFRFDNERVNSAGIDQNYDDVMTIVVIGCLHNV